MEDPLETLKKLRRKVSRRRKIPAQKIFGHGRDSNPSLCLADLKKFFQKIRSRGSYISVAVSGSQLIKLIKSFTSLVLKKEKKEKSLL